MALTSITRLSIYRAGILLQIRRRSAVAGTRDIQGASKRSSIKSTAVDRPLERLSTAALLRTVFLSRIFASPTISRLGISLLSRLANSRQPLLDPDRNPVLRRVLCVLIYNHFCAGNESPQIRRTIERIKEVGYKGVILNYAREIVAHELAETDPTVDASAQQIQQWLDGNMKTLSCVGPGDYIGIKYTGAGSRIASALTAGEEPPKAFRDALEKLCQQAKAQGSYILVDAEHQVYQPAIDQWTVNLMRKYNRDSDALILNTYQAYLKASRVVLRKHLELAQLEGWILGVKLVRGAYIFQEERNRIHDTKGETDDSYNSIAHDLLRRSFDGMKRPKFPGLKLFLAGHNLDSIRRAAQLHRDLVLQGLEPGSLEFGQLYGMADHVSGELLAMLDAHQQTMDLTEAQATMQRKVAPKVFKCVNWGSVRECLNFLIRRATENQGGAERLQDGLREAKKELKARLLRRIQ